MGSDIRTAIFLQQISLCATELFLVQFWLFYLFKLFLNS